MMKCLKSRLESSQGGGLPKNEMWAVGFGVSGNRQRKAGMIRLVWEVLFARPVLGCWKIQIKHFWAAAWGGSTDCDGKEWIGVSRKELERNLCASEIWLIRQCHQSPWDPGEPCAPWNAELQQLGTEQGCGRSCLCSPDPSLFAEWVQNGCTASTLTDQSLHAGFKWRKVNKAVFKPSNHLCSAQRELWSPELFWVRGEGHSSARGTRSGQVSHLFL